MDLYASMIAETKRVKKSNTKREFFIVLGVGKRFSLKAFPYPANRVNTYRTFAVIPSEIAKYILVCLAEFMRMS